MYVSDRLPPRCKAKRVELKFQLKKLLQSRFAGSTLRSNKLQGILAKANKKAPPLHLS